MIFVTVGTHEQPFNRLISFMDLARVNGVIEDDCFAQIGYGTTPPGSIAFQPLVPFEEVQRLVASADVVVTHGGPASIMLSLQHGKIPVVVPRMKKYGEHVNDHQVDFVKRLESAGRVIAVYDIQHLPDAIARAKSCAASSAGQNPEVERLVSKMSEYCTSIGLKPMTY